MIDRYERTRKAVRLNAAQAESADQVQALRNSGWLSTDNAHTGRIAWLRHHYPDQFRMLVANFPQVTRWVS